MTSFSFVLSFLTSPRREFASWIQRASEHCSILADREEISLELRAQREGFEGHLEDNPPLERLDSFLVQADEESFRFSSLFLPVALERSGDARGLEISAVNGWTDLAAYSGISLVRLHLISPMDQWKMECREALTQIVGYLHELDIDVSISGSDAIKEDLDTFIRDCNKRSELLCGADICLTEDEISSLAEKIKDASSLGTITIRLTDPLSDSLIQEVNKRLNECLDKPCPAVVFEI